MSPIFRCLALFFSFIYCSSESVHSIDIPLSEKEKQFLQMKKSLSMCVGTDFMPYEDIQNGQYIGMISEYMAIVSENIGIPFILIPTVDWNETMHKARTRECDIVTFIISTPERKKFLNFTRPYIGEPLVIATKDDKPFVVDVKNIQDKRLGIVRGYAYVEILSKRYPGINIVEVDSTFDGLKKLSEGDLYAYLDGLNVIGYHIQKSNVRNLKINGTLKNNWDISIGSRNDMPIINDILNKGLDSISDRQRKQIDNSWVKVKYEHGFDHDLIILISVVVTLIFTFMFYHQYILRKHNKMLESLSETDKLTGINNRLKLDKFLQYHVDLFERYHETFSIVLIDIDHFKKFNDKYGHLMGDKVLIHVANLLKKNCRKMDMLGRWGGEEFLVICPKTGLDGIRALAEIIRSKVENNHLKNVDGVTVSLGIAEMSVNDNFNTLLNRADKALYSAKEKGRNRVEESQS